MRLPTPNPLGIIYRPPDSSHTQVGCPRASSTHTRGGDDPTPYHTRVGIIIPQPRRLPGTAKILQIPLGSKVLPYIRMEFPSGSVERPPTSYNNVLEVGTIHEGIKTYQTRRNAFTLLSRDPPPLKRRIRYHLSARESSRV